MYQRLKPEQYHPRLIDAKIQECLRDFGGVEIKGPKFCGKTWSSLAFSNSVTHVDDLDVQNLIKADPKLALRGEAPVAIDEWQEVPQIWDAARRTIDERAGNPGQFIFTGSSTPNKSKVVHSGAGRIAGANMATMTLFEKEAVSGGVSLAGLFEGKFEPADANVDLTFFANHIVKGGWPVLLSNNNLNPSNLTAQYLSATFDVSVPKKGGEAGTAWNVARALARNVGTNAKLNTIASDCQLDNKTTASRYKISEYLEIFNELYLLQEIPGWDAPLRSKARLRTKPKRYFCDTSLACSLLNVNEERLLSDGQLFGILFEALCIHDLGVFAQMLPGNMQNSLHYYRDSDGLEVDAIIELIDGRWAGIEIKLGQEKAEEGFKTLNRLRKKITSSAVAQNKNPEFMAVVTATSKVAYFEANEDVYVIPFACLEP